MPEERVRLALTIGDPGGIGPEISAALLAGGKLSTADIYIIGSAAALKGAMPGALGGSIKTLPYDEGFQPDIPSSFPVIIDTGGGTEVPVGRPSAEGGRAAGLALGVAISLARGGAAEGIVTGPISKEALGLAGYPYRGHTEMLADLLDSPDCQMMMVAGDLRVVILTRDVALREVPGMVTVERIRSAVKVTERALRELFGVKKPRMAVSALNPHSGDGGVIGCEERDVIIPAVGGLKNEGIDVTGPFPADTLFHRWREKGYDAFIAIYHDQGMIPFKMVGFERGVNMTIGLPVVRTSVCHGTAFDIAGRGGAGTGSMEAALALALRCCLAKRESSGG